MNISSTWTRKEEGSKDLKGAEGDGKKKFASSQLFSPILIRIQLGVPV